jgi:hypothetical protein
LYLYFQAVNSDNAGTNSMRIAIVQRYNLYAFMWDKFGYKPHEVDQLDVSFIRSMAAVASADGRATRDRMNQRR